MFWPFANPWMLLWGLAVAVPIAIHLWSRRRFAEQTWAAMDFLLAALRKSAARMRMEQWLLLAVRSLVLLLLAAALAKPIVGLRTVGTGGATGERTYTILVFDRSYSMSCVERGETRFEAARRLALQQVAAADRGDSCSIVEMGDPPRLVTPQPVLEPDIVAEEIEELAPSQQTADLPRTLALVDRAVDHAQRVSQAVLQVRVCIFSDMDRAAWDDVATSAESSAAASLIESIAAKATLNYVDVGRAEAANAAVARLEALPSLSTAGEAIDMEVEVRGFGEPQWRRELEILVDGEPLLGRSVAGADGESVVERFAHRFSSPGPHVVEARLNADSLVVDDRRWLALDVRPSLRILCIEGAPGAARFVAAALDALAARGVRVQTETSSDAALVQRDLSQFDCVVLCNVAGFVPQEALALDAFTRGGGGGLIVFLGDRTQPESYNAQLVHGDAGRALLPAQIGELAAAGTYRFDPLDYRHPTLAPFRGHPRAGLLTSTVRRYYRLTEREGANAEIALAFANGDPAVVTAPVGRGYCTLVATAASDQSIDPAAPSTEWADFYREPLFPPLLERMVALAAQHEAKVLNLRVGDPATGHSDGASSVTITPPESPASRPVTIEIDPGSDAWSYGAADVSGVYHVRRDAGEAGEMLFAVNVDPRESSLMRIDPASLPGELKPLPAEASPGVANLALGPARPLHAALLAAVLLVLAVEMGLAWRFGSAAA